MIIFAESHETTASQTEEGPEGVTYSPQTAGDTSRPARITWNVQATQTEEGVPPGEEEMEQYQVEVLKPHLTPGVRNKPKKHLVVSQRLQTLVDKLKPQDDIKNHVEIESKDFLFRGCP